MSSRSVRERSVGPLARDGLYPADAGDHVTHGRSRESRPRDASRAIRRQMRLATQLLAICSAWTATAARTDAAPYYTVTSIGGADLTGNSEAITNTQTGVSYPFVSTTTPLMPNDMSNLPGPANPQAIESGYLPSPWLAMTPFAINSSGTVIGSILSGPGVSASWEGPTSQTLGYAIRSPDGQYTPYQALIDGSTATTPGQIFLSQSNQILVENFTSGTSLFDVKTGTMTPITQLIPPSFLQPFPPGSVQGDAIDDRGDILVTADWRSTTSSFILTPPGLSAPVPSPEPSSLWIFGLIAGAWGSRTFVRRFRERV